MTQPLHLPPGAAIPAAAAVEAGLAVAPALAAAGGLHAPFPACHGLCGPWLPAGHCR